VRATGVAFRTPVTWQARTGNQGDGDTFAAPVPLLGSVKSPRTVRRDTQGQTVTDPMVLELPHDAGVQIGDRVTVDGNTGHVETAELARGAFGVPHHLTVRAL
jgi:hypothetical protein